MLGQKAGGANTGKANKQVTLITKTQTVGYDYPIADLRNPDLYKLFLETNSSEVESLASAPGISRRYAGTSLGSVIVGYFNSLVGGDLALTQGGQQIKVVLPKDLQLYVWERGTNRVNIPRLNVNEGSDAAKIKGYIKSQSLVIVVGATQSAGVFRGTGVIVY